MMGVVGDAGVLGGLGAVLREVAGNLLACQDPVGDISAAAGAHGSRVELASERQHSGRILSVDAGHGKAHRCDGVAYQAGKLVGIDGSG